jgi:hypothetical protein
MEEFLSDGLCDIIGRVLSRDSFGKKKQAFRIIDAIWLSLRTEEEKSVIPEEIVCQYLDFLEAAGDSCRG